MFKVKLIFTLWTGTDSGKQARDSILSFTCLLGLGVLFSKGELHGECLAKV